VAVTRCFLLRELGQTALSGTAMLTLCEALLIQVVVVVLCTGWSSRLLHWPGFGQVRILER
jgi:hypothetical protein